MSDRVSVRDRQAWAESVGISYPIAACMSVAEAQRYDELMSRKMTDEVDIRATVIEVDAIVQNAIAVLRRGLDLRSRPCIDIQGIAVSGIPMWRFEP